MALLIVALAPAAGAWAGEDGPTSEGPLSPRVWSGGGTGIALSRGAAAVPEGLVSRSPETRCSLLIEAGREEMDDPARIDPMLEEARARGLRVVIRLLDVGAGAAADWPVRLLTFARAVGGRADAYQVLGPTATASPPRDYAYDLKNARVAIRAADSSAAVVSAPLGPGDTAWARAMFDADAAPYLDAIAAATLGSLPATTALRDQVYPRAPIWVTDEPFPAGAGPADAIDRYLDGIALGAQVVLLRPEPIPAAAPEARPLGATLSLVRSDFPTTLRPASPAALPFDPAKGTAAGGAAPGPAAVRVVPFFDSETRDGLAAYRSEGAAPPPAVRFKLRSPLDEIDLIVPESGEVRILADRAAAGEILELPLRSSYLLARYRLAAAQPLKEQERVGAVSELSAEEIIAREREVRGAQEARLPHYEARAVIGLHYHLATIAESVDLVTENRMYVHDGKSDLEQTALYIDGALWRGKTSPHLPYLQPETVNQVPLDIVLDERYRYHLDGRDKVDDRDCYALSFEPVDSAQSLYRGRVFIDTRLFTRVRMEAVQTGLADPLRSSEVVFHYGPVPAPWGDAWLPISMKGQMTFELLGYSLGVDRVATYSDFRLNQEGFEGRVQEAYGSGRPLFRETGAGLYRLDVTGGQESLSSLNEPRNTLLLMGISAGESSVSFPFAGINFFDFDFHGTGTQLNMALAGVFNDIAWTQPNLFHTGPGRRPWALAVQGTFNALEGEEKNATLAGTPSDDRVRLLRESILATLAIPVGTYVRTSLTARTIYQHFRAAPDTSRDFVVPLSDFETSFLGRVEYARLGYLAAGWGEWGERNRWEAWGLPGQPFSPDDRNFTRLGIDLRKAFYYGIYQKFEVAASGYDGRGLDRFSRFQLGDFRSARVRGFNDSGIHFDRGLVLDTTYSFPLARSLRADIGVQEGWIQSVDDFGPGYQRVAGAGLSVEFSGPWSTYWTVRTSTGLSSTIPDKGGGGDLRLVVLRTFDKWGRRGGGAGTPRPATPQPPEPSPPAPPLP